MTTRKSHSIQKEKCEKPLSNSEMERLAQSQIYRKEGYQEKSKETSNKVWINKKISQTNIDRPYQPNKTTIKPIIETNLKPEDFDSLSNIMGEEIATIVVHEIVSQQSPKLLDTTREIA